MEDLVARPYEFVEDDGKLVGETPLHGAQIFGLLAALGYLLRDEPDAYVGSNTFFYYDENDLKRSICPDVYVGHGLGRPLVDLRVFRCWEERSTPRLIVEVSSCSTFEEDLYRKKGIYQDVLGVEEYLIFDPEGDVVPEQLRAYRLFDGAYQEVGSGPFVSQVVPATFRVLEGRLRLVDTKDQILPEDAVEGKQLGRIEGRVEGRVEGHVEGQQKLLLRQICVRFKLEAVPSGVEARLAVATEAQLEVWGERVLTATTLEDVFSE